MIENIRSGVAAMQAYSYCQFAAPRNGPISSSMNNNHMDRRGSMMLHPSNVAVNGQKTTLTFDEWNSNNCMPCYTTSIDAACVSGMHGTRNEEGRNDRGNSNDGPASKYQRSNESQRIASSHLPVEISAHPANYPNLEYESIRNAWSIHHSTVGSEEHSMHHMNPLSAYDDSRCGHIPHEAQEHYINNAGASSPLILPNAFVEELLSIIPNPFSSPSTNTAPYDLTNNHPEEFYDHAFNAVDIASSRPIHVHNNHRHASYQHESQS
jgi:hypothetical protein